MKNFSIFLLIIASGFIFGFSINKAKMFTKEKALFSFGAIADCQYSDYDDKNERKYRLSKSKLENCINHFNTIELEFVVHLGDFIDKDFSSFNTVQPIFYKLEMPGYHVLGNHDFDIADEHKNKVCDALGMQSGYYDFTVKNWRFIVLNGNDISFYAHPVGSEKYKKATQYYKENNLDAPKWNGGIGEKQLSWFENQLEDATTKNQNVIVFCHFPLYPEDIHNLWNASELIEMIEKYPVVKAYLNGHNHGGNYGIKNGVHYVNLKGMVDTEETSYAIIDIFEDHIQINGFGREEDRSLSIK